MCCTLFADIFYSSNANCRTAACVTNLICHASLLSHVTEKRVTGDYFCTTNAVFFAKCQTNGRYRNALEFYKITTLLIALSASMLKLQSTFPDIPSCWTFLSVVSPIRAISNVTRIYIIVKNSVRVNDVDQGEIRER